jgi:hypothetical protein
MKKEEKFLKLITEKINTEDQKTKFIKLLNQDVEKFSESIIDTYIKEIEKNTFGNEDELIVEHNPLKTLKFFEKFVNEHIYKYTTHLWDVERNGLESYENFIDEINHKDNIKQLEELFYVNRLTYNHINNFLGKPINKETFWMYFNKQIHIGWQYPYEVWNENKKYRYIDEKSNINLNQCISVWLESKNKPIISFEDIIRYFKSTIRTNKHEDNSFKDIVDRALKDVDIHKDIKVNFKNIDSVNCYLNTVALYNLIKLIFSEIKKFVDQGKNNVDLEIIKFKEIKSIEIHIKHLDSLPTKELELDRVNKFFTGDSYKKYKYIYSNFDYEVCSDFKIEGIDNRVPYSLLIFEKESTKCKINKKDGNVNEILSENKAIKLSQNIGGFLHKIKIYY